MQAAKSEHHPAQREHFRQGKLQTQGEQQEYHAQLGEVREFVTFVHPIERRGPDHQPHAEVTQHRRQAQAPEQGNDHQGGGEDDQQIGKH